MTTDQLKGKWIQFSGDLKQHWGRLMKNDLLQNQGSYDKIIGMLQERYGGRCAGMVRERYGENRNELLRWASQWQQRLQPETMKNMMRWRHHWVR